MTEEVKQLTKEEQEAQDRAAAEYAAERIASFEFMSKHLNDVDYGFAQTPENSEKMSDFIKGKGWKWSTQALQAAYEALSAAGELTKVVLPAEAEPVEKAEPITEKQFPWGTLTAETLEAMSAREMQRYLKSPQWGRVFEEQVNALNLSRSFLKANL